MEEHRDLNRGAKGVAKFLISAVLLCLALIAMRDLCCADNAEVLPQGRSAIFIEGKFYFPVDERYGPDGDEEKIAQDFNSTLNSDDGNGRPQILVCP